MLHLDRADFYGENSASLTLRQYDEYLSQDPPPFPLSEAITQHYDVTMEDSPDNDGDHQEDINGEVEEPLANESNEVENFSFDDLLAQSNSYSIDLNPFVSAKPLKNMLKKLTNSYFLVEALSSSFLFRLA